jgi:1-acyl-sn-glycerol-3-phosphate acyltransferase
MKDWSYDTAKDHGVAPVERFRSTKREAGLISTLAHMATMSAVVAFFRTFHRMRVVNRNRFPLKPPFVVCANHSSHFDAIILAAAMPPQARAVAYAVAAGDVFFTSATTSVLSSLLVNALPLWRKKVTTHALEELRERLLEGHAGLILFPEGARSRDGGPLKFKPGIGMIIAGTSVPVVPCHIEGAFESMPPGARIPRPYKITVRVGEPLRFENVERNRQGWDSVSMAIRASIGAMSPKPWPEPTVSTES